MSVVDIVNKWFARKERVTLKQGAYVPHCRHCLRSSTQHVNTKCLWTPTSFEPLYCPVCKTPLLFEDDNRPLPSPAEYYTENDCGKCNKDLPA